MAVCHLIKTDSLKNFYLLSLLLFLINLNNYWSFFNDPFKEMVLAPLNLQSNHKNEEDDGNSLLDDLMDVIHCKLFTIKLYIIYIHNYNF